MQIKTTTSRKPLFSVLNLVYCALLVAMNVALGRLVGIMPEATSRYSIEAVPTFLAGLLFGPVAGAMVGFCGDFIGCLFTPYGYNPLFCVPPILYGLVAGLFRGFLQKKFTLPRLILAFLPAVLLGSVLYQSAALAFVYYHDTFVKGFLLKLSTRSVQFAIVSVLDITILYALFRTRVFDRLGLWKLQK